jgi:hypothetical protein
MRASRLFTTVVVVAALSFFAADSVAAQSAAQSEPTLKPAKERGAKASNTETVANTDMTKQRRFSLCIESWDAQTHMSKQEWRAACRRSLVDYPDAFTR